MEPIRIPPYEYIHVLDSNKCITKVVTGPTVYVCLVHERIVKKREKMLVIPPNHYSVIENPVMRKSKDGKQENENVPVSLSVIVFDEYGQAKLRHGEQEIRFEQEAHPLYPGEILITKVVELTVVKEGTALRMHALRDFFDKVEGRKRKGGEEWLLHGPMTLIPQVHCTVEQTIVPVVVEPNEGLVIRARKDCVDKNGEKRKAGEMWMIREVGEYLPAVDEIVVRTQKGIILTDRKALHLRALDTFTDVYGKERKAGQEWLVTVNEAEVHIPDVTGREELVDVSKLITLENHQYMYIDNPVDEEGAPQHGKRILVSGPKNFFLQPGEVAASAPLNAEVLAPELTMQLIAKDEFVDEFAPKKPVRKPGLRYYVYGPTSYMIPPQSSKVRVRRAELYNESLGIYIFFTTPLPLLISMFIVCLVVYSIYKAIF